MTEAKQKINKALVNHLAEKDGDGKTVIWDSELTGFGVRLGKKVPVYVLGYRAPGKAYSRVSIGRADRISAEAARNMAKQMIGEAASGVDPQAEKKERRKAAKAAAALERKQGQALLPKVIEQYLDWLRDRRRSTHHIGAARRYTKGRMVPLWGNLPIAAITKSDARDLLASIPNENSSVRHSVYTHGRALWAWAIKEDLVEQNLWAAMHAPPKPEPRTNWLNDDEIKSFWQATGEIEEPWQSMCRMLLLTGARRNEIAGMQWGELDRSKLLLTIKADERGTKTKHDYFIPLVNDAVQMLDQVAQGTDWPSSGPVFSTNGTTSSSGFSKAVARLRGLMRKHGYKKHFILHDLRRTHATNLERLGIRPDIVLLAQNKTSAFKMAAASYLWYSYESEIRSAMEQWRDHVMECVN